MNHLVVLCALGSVACTGVIADPPSGPAQRREDPPPEVCIGDEPHAVAQPARLLTRYEYAHTMADLLGVESVAFGRFPRENRAFGFENDARAHTASPLLVQLYLEEAERIAAIVARDRLSEIAPCAVDADEIACGRDLVRSLAPRAFRRPAEADELALLDALFAEALAVWGYVEASRLVVEAVLQSPQLLYRVEPSADLAPGEVRPVGPYEMASRLSYFLWASMPDDALLDSAAAGTLSTPAGVEAEARRMLDDARALDAVRHFHRQWLGFDAFDSIVKDEVAFPELPAGGVGALRSSVEAFVNDTFFDGYERLMLSTTLHLPPSIAPLFGASPGGFGLVVLDAPAAQRAGLLTQPGLMALLANADQASPIRRGVFVRERLLCDDLPPPPADVPIVPPDPNPTLTTRERFAAHTEDPTCAGCHELIDPVGFLFEHYDGIGRFRAVENGLPIDSEGAVHDASEPSLEGPIVDAVDLGSRFATSDTVRDCVATQWYRFATGRRETGDDRCVLDDVRARFRDSGGDFRELLVAIATSDAMRHQVGAEGEVTP